jgi:hypothetical protein
MPTKNDWLTAVGFEQAHEVASAINTLSIHAKLLLAGARDPTPTQDIQQARQRLISFVERLQSVVKDVRDKRAVVGADPQMADVVLALLTETRRDPSSRGRPRLLDDLPSLIESERSADLHLLVKGLQQLRSLVEVDTRSEPVELASS